MKAGVCTSKNEGDIIGSTVRHLLDQGIDEIWIYDAMSVDGTREALQGLPVHIFDDRNDVHYQPKLTTELAHVAREHGASWVVPFDADEYWSGINGTIAEVLDAQPGNVSKVTASVFHHYTWDQREVVPKPLGKVCFRAHPQVEVANGNHDAYLPGDTAPGLQVRELQFRGVDHFVRKVRERCATLDPSLNSMEGAHQTRFRTFTDDELRAWWHAENPFWGARRTVIEDPIPSNWRV